MYDISDVEREIARYSAGVFNKEADLFPFFNDDESIAVLIMSAEGRPEQGVTSYATVGLSNTPVEYFGRQVNVELLGACNSDIPYFENVLSSVAIQHILDRKSCFHGNVVENIIAQYDASIEMKHVFLTAQSLWEGFSPTSFGSRVVHWLLAVPISDAELQIWASGGYLGLERALETAGANIFDIRRGSI